MPSFDVTIAGRVPSLNCPTAADLSHILGDQLLCFVKFIRMAKNKHRSQSSAGLLGLPTHQSKRYLKSERPARGFLARTLINSAVLYSLYWILYACPSGIPTSDAPQVCKRYYDIKSVLVTKAAPYVQPVYEQYAGPYLAKGKPYYDQANSLYEQYAKPGVQKSQSVYNAYVHPTALKGAQKAKSQYNARVAPSVNKHVSKFHATSRKTYEQYLGKYVNLAHAEYNNKLAPHVAYAQRKGHEAYVKALPYAEIALKSSSAFISTHVYPRVLDLLSWLSHFVETRILPTLRRFYYLHIEPQVNKVSDRLFAFNVSNGFASLNSVSPASIESAVSASILASAKSTAKIESTVIAGETHTIEAAQPSVDAKTQSKIDRAVIDDLLTQAEENIAKEGAAAEEALLNKLGDILPVMVKKEELLSADYLTQLEAITLQEVEAVEQKIISLAKSQANHGKSADDLTEELRPSFIRAGKNIHAQAVEVKAHLSTVIDSLEAKVNKAAYVVYDQVLSEGQNQKKVPEQKMRYEMEDVSKKELKRLDALDSQIKAIENKLSAVAGGTLKDYTKELNNLLKETNAKVESLANGAANKLHTLRNIGPKKITVGDDSEEFGHGYLPKGAMLGIHAIYNQLSTGIYGEPEPTPELPEQAYNSAKSFVAGLSTKIDTDSIASVASVAASAASEQGLRAARAAGTAIADIDTDAIASSASSAASVASKQAASAYSAASKAAGKVDTDKVYASIIDAKEYIGEQAADVAGVASEAVYGTRPALTERLASRASEIVHGTEVPVAESLKSQANEALAGASAHAEQAFAAASGKMSQIIHGTPVPFTESVASRASEAIYGSETPAVESLLSRMQHVYDDAKTKVEEMIPGHEPVLSAASNSASSAASSLSSVASKSSESLSRSASSASSLASKSAASVSSLAAKSASSASSLASKSSSSMSSLAAKSAASASSVASRSAESASSRAAASLSSAKSAASTVASEEATVINSVVDKAWEDYANAKEKVAEAVENIRERVEL